MTGAGRRQAAAAPAELRELQRKLTGLLRSPLDLRARKAVADTRRYDAGLIADVVDGPRADARSSLAVYHRQYWLRLFQVLEREFPLTARLIGLPRFYAHAQAHLLEVPPRAPDLGRVGDGFVAWCRDNARRFEGEADALPRAALQQALAIDEAWRGVWSAAGRPAFVPSTEQAAALPRTQLRMAPTARLVEETWPLVELRRQLTTDASAHPLALPKKLGSTRHWLILRTADGIGQLRLAPQQARLYALCAQHVLEQAVERLHDGQSREARAGLAERIREWLAQSMELKLWVQ